MFEVTLSGKITKDLILKKVKNNDCCNLTIAAKQGNKEHLIRCSAWKELAGIVYSSFKKGDYVKIKGRGAIIIPSSVLNVDIDTIEYHKEK